MGDLYASLQVKLLSLEHLADVWVCIRKPESPVYIASPKENSLFARQPGLIDPMAKISTYPVSISGWHCASFSYSFESEPTSRTSRYETIPL